MTIERRLLSPSKMVFFACAPDPLPVLRASEHSKPHAGERRLGIMAIENLLPHGLEPWTSRLLAERSSQLSYESS